MHELAHIILQHKASRVATTEAGLMILDTYDKSQEKEADWLGGTLLVPRDALLKLLDQQGTNDGASTHFRVRSQMITWRRRMTGLDA